MQSEKPKPECTIRWSGLVFALLISCFLSTGALAAQAPAATKEPAKEPPYPVEYYYKVQWGHADEWLALFKKNHLPVLRALKEQGRILEIEIEKPRYHATEDARWDFRVTITWKNIAASIDPAGTEQALIRKLFPDQETFRREEQRRFEILLAHWDLPVVEVTLEP